MELTEVSIEQMNIIIADFMGYCYSTSKFYPKNRNPNGWFKKAKYHTSWDWLMPVVKKIKGMHFDILQKTLIMEYMHAAAPMNSALISIDLKKLHVGVYNFLLWYNQQINKS